MTWQEAIKQSKRGTASRVINYDNGMKRTIIMYNDGSAFSLASKNGKVDYFLSRPAQDFETRGFEDWVPSENLQEQ